MLSGIGPADHLSHLDIPVVIDAPEIGRNLQNHPSYALRFACSQPVTAYKYLNPRAALGIGLRYAITHRGSLAESYVATGGYMRSDPALCGFRHDRRDDSSARCPRWGRVSSD
jgi:choline dehydrogenase